MGEMDIELDNNLIERIKNLAVRHYGDSSDASISRVAESALEMYLLSIRLVEGGGNEIEEPLATWEFSNNQPEGKLPVAIRDWLFKRR